jgi:cupin 2 domain-containing protein
MPSAGENDGESAKNLFDRSDLESPHELVQTICEAGDIRIERMVSHGHASPDGFWYDQDQDEWVVMLTGAAQLEFEDGLKEMKPGDFVNIPAHRRHRVEWTTPNEPTIWLAVSYGRG